MQYHRCGTKLYRIARHCITSKIYGKDTKNHFNSDEDFPFRKNFPRGCNLSYSLR